MAYLTLGKVNADSKSRVMQMEGRNDSFSSARFLYEPYKVIIKPEWYVKQKMLVIYRHAGDHAAICDLLIKSKSN